MSDHEDLEKKRELLERSANRTRARLIDAVIALDERRHELTDVKGQLHKQVQEHAKPLAVIGGSVVLAVGAILALSIYRLATRKEHVREERWKALRRFWNHPERLARKDPPKGSVAAELGRKILISALTFAAIELTKRGVRNALPAVPNGPAARPHVIVRTLPA